MNKVYAETVTVLLSFGGIYDIIQTLWEEAEIAEFGKYVVSKADSFACFVISLTIVALLTAWRLCNEL